jgi:ribosomal protein S27AE
MKTLLFDIETSPNLAYVWGQYEQDVIKQVKESEIISIAWKWLGEKKIYSLCLNDFKKDREYNLVKKLYDLMDTADNIVGHNCKSFDNKMANRAFIYYGFTPPSPYKVIDTLSEIKKRFRFNSNHLNDVAQYLGLGKKIETGGFDLWLGCIQNNKKSWELLKKYNRNDVALLEKVYLKILPWIENHPVVSDNSLRICPNCGSVHFQSRGWSISNVFKSKRYQCQNCGKWFSGEKVKYKI